MTPIGGLASPSDHGRLSSRLLSYGSWQLLQLTLMTDGPPIAVSTPPRVYNAWFPATCLLPTQCFDAWLPVDIFLFAL